MKNVRWTMSAAALCMFALSAYGCSDSSADDADDDSSSSSGGSSGGSSGRSSSSGGRSSSSSSGGSTSSSSGGSTSSSGGSTSSSSSGGSSSSSGGSSSSSGGSSSSSGGPSNCTALTLDAFQFGGEGIYGATYAEGPGEDDITIVEVLDEATGSFNLANEAQYATCERCVTVYQGTKRFFQTEGTIAIAANSTLTNFNATLTNVKLVEVTVAAAPDYTSTPVAGGACVTIANAPVVAAEEP